MGPSILITVLDAKVSDTRRLYHQSVEVCQRHLRSRQNQRCIFRQPGFLWNIRRSVAILRSRRAHIIQWIAFAGAELRDGGFRGRKKCYKKSTPLLAPWTSQSNIPDSSSDKQVYSYKPLGRRAIRLLHPLPGENKDEDLQGVMVHVSSLDSSDDYHYQALFYIRGADTREEELLTPDGIIRITPSLSAALRHLRQRKWGLFF